MFHRYIIVFIFTSLLGSMLFADSAVHRYHITQTFLISQSNIKLWIPLPLRSSYQNVYDISLKGNYLHYEKNSDAVYGAKMMYVEFEPTHTQNKATLEFTVEVHDRSIDFSKRLIKPIQENLSPYLDGGKNNDTDEVIKSYADKITTNASTDLQKAKSIYDWVVKNMFRDPSVIGCGKGDACDSFASGDFGGKCADISAVFVSLLRAAGIPAREVFGIRAGPSKYSKAYGIKGNDITTSQHCRSEFYIKEYGWIPADPADIIKLIFVENLAVDSARVKKEVKRQFGNWEMNWFAYNHARNVVLVPQSVQSPIDMFSYPYAEKNGEPLNYYEPSSFVYNIKVEPLSFKDK
jgi:transglutaminase-like putative cysteine protease